MKAYWGIFRMRLLATLQYRAAAWAGVVTQFFWGAMLIMVFAAFYQSGDGESAMPFADLVDYIWLQQAFLSMIALWSQDDELLDMIASGNFAYEMIRPYRVYSFWFARMLALRLARASLRCLPILAVAFFLPAGYRLHLPPDAAAFGLFLLSMALAALLVVALSMFVCLLTFVTLTPHTSRMLIGVTGELAMGSLIPIPLMPEGLQRVLDFLPFRYVADFPFRIYSGNIAGAQAWLGIGAQVFWIVSLAMLGIYGFRRVQKHIVVQGG